MTITKKSKPMRGIIGDRKRMRGQPSSGIRESPFVPSGLEDGHGREIKPPYRPGEVCWVKETWSSTPDGHVHYRDTDEALGPWRSPVTMPRWAARRFVRVTSIKPVEVEGIWEWTWETEEVEKP